MLTSLKDCNRPAARRRPSSHPGPCQQLVGGAGAARWHQLKDDDDEDVSISLVEFTCSVKKRLMNTSLRTALEMLLH